MIPSLFVAHGSPMVAIETSEYAKFLEHLGQTLPRPRAVVVFSSHWESDVQAVSEVESYATIHDFGGFPEELYRIEYPAKGDAALARDILRRLEKAGIPCRADRTRGLDHGVWTILRRMFPAADIPVIAMSVNPELEPIDQYRLGQTLCPLRAQDVLIIGSGVLVHNFRLLYTQHRAAATQMGLAFEDWVEDRIRAWDLDALFQYQEAAPYAAVAVPPHSREHFVPLFYAMGAADDARTARLLHRSLLMDVMTNTVYQFGA